MPIASEPSQPHPQTRSRSRGWSLGAVLLVVTCVSLAQSPRPSPFVGRGGSTATSPQASAAPADAMLEFSGITKIGSSTLVCITTLSDKRSVWVEVGKTVNGIQAVAYQAEVGSVTVRHHGREVTLPIKQPSYDSSTLVAYQPPLPAGPAPMAGVAPTVAVTDEEKETEARMLVSDLLEIGMIQRQAYQEARTRELEAKRAEKAGAEAAPAPPPGAPTQEAPR